MSAGAPPPLFLITGAMASGKSSVAQALAERFDAAVHLRGDVFRKMIVSGRARMDAVLSAEARRQLDLRQDLAIAAARRYHAAGFVVVYQDIVLGADLARVAAALAALAPRIVLLDPDAQTLAARDAGRAKTGYGAAFPPSALKDVIDRETPALGLRLDTTALTVDETVARILEHYGLPG